MADVLPTLLNPSRLAAYTAAGFWGNETIYLLAARQARVAPCAFAVRDRYWRMTYAALVDATDRLAANLAGRGIRPGQRVAVWLPSRAETAIALLACSRNGYVCCPSLHRDHTVGEVVALVDRARAAVLIAQPGTAPTPTDMTCLHSSRIATSCAGCTGWSPPTLRRYRSAM